MSNDVDELEPDGGATSDTMEEQSREATDSDKTVPQVDLTLRDLAVSVTGRSDDDLETVEQSALSMMEQLVQKAESLEDDRDDYGLT